MRVVYSFDFGGFLSLFLETWGCGNMRILEELSLRPRVF